MPLQSGIYPSTTISFIVKNNSSINRAIKVFGVKINPGGTLDLMTVPGVTEEDIRSELTKGSLKSLFVGKSLTVVSSTINFSSNDPSHQQFLTGIGLSGFVSNTASALSQSNWWIDGLNGSDGNTGLTAATPLKTFARLFAMLGGSDGSTINWTIPLVTINFINHQVSDAISGITLKAVSSNTQVVFQGGTPTLVTNGGTGAFTAVRAQVTASNTPPGTTDPGAVWVPGLRRRNTTVGARFGAVDFILKDEGAGVARANNACVNSFNSNATGLITHLVGDTYVLEQLPKLYVDTLTLLDNNASLYLNGPAFHPFNILEGDLSPIPGKDNCIGGTSGLALHRSILSGTSGGGGFKANRYIGSISLYMKSSCIYDASVIGGNQGFLFAGIYSCGVGVNSAAHPYGLFTTASQAFGGAARFNNWIGQSFPIYLVGNGILLSTFANFDQTVGGNSALGDGVNIGNPFNPGYPGNAVITGPLWGSGNAGVGLTISDNSTCTVLSAAVASTITITGTAGDFQLGKTRATGLVACSYDPTTLVQTATLPTTWANFVAAVGGTGFGGRAHNPSNNAHLNIAA